GPPPADPGRGARAETAGGRDAVDAGERDALERPRGGLVGHAHAAHDEVVAAGRQPAHARAGQRHADAVGLARADLVVEREREAERVEARTEVRGGGGDTDTNAQRRAQSRLSSHSGVSETAQELRIT